MDVRLFLRVILCSGLLLSACSDESSPQKPSNTDTGSGDEDDESSDDDDDSTSSRGDAGRDAGRTRDAGRDAGADDEGEDDAEDEDEDDSEDDAGATDDEVPGPTVDGGDRIDAGTGAPVPPPADPADEEAVACAEVAKIAQPIIAAGCARDCHAKGEFPLTNIAQITGLADRIAALVVGPSMDTLQMPPGQPLPREDQEAVVAWMGCLQPAD